MPDLSVLTGLWGFFFWYFYYFVNIGPISIFVKYILQIFKKSEQHFSDEPTSIRLEFRFGGNNSAMPHQLSPSDWIHTNICSNKQTGTPVLYKPHAMRCII